MTCRQLAPNAWICGGGGHHIRRVRHCPNCDQRRRFVGYAEEWYDTIWTCCACGDAWTVEGRMARPFARGWRKESIRHAKKAWATP